MCVDQPLRLVQLVALVVDLRDENGRHFQHAGWRTFQLLGQRQRLVIGIKRGVECAARFVRQTHHAQVPDETVSAVLVHEELFGLLGNDGRAHVVEHVGAGHEHHCEHRARHVVLGARIGGNPLLAQRGGLFEITAVELQHQLAVQQPVLVFDDCVAGFGERGTDVFDQRSRGGEVPVHQLDPRLIERQPRVLAQNIRADGIDRGAKRTMVAGIGQRAANRVQRLRREVQIMRCAGEFKRFFGQLLLSKPEACRFAQLSNLGHTQAVLQLLLQEILEQMVVAKPGSLGIQRDEEQIGLLQLSEHGLAADIARHRLAIRGAHAPEDGGAQQEALEFGRLRIEHVIEQVSAHALVLARQGLGDIARLAVELHGEPGQLQTHAPAFGGAVQHVDAGLIQIGDIARAKVVLGLDRTECQRIGIDDLQFLLGTQLPQGQLLVVAGCKHVSDAVRAIADDGFHQIGQQRRVDILEVVQENPDLLLDGRYFRERGVDVDVGVDRFRFVKQPKELDPKPRQRAAHRGHQVQHEVHQRGVVAVETRPTHLVTLILEQLVGLAHRHRFSVTGGSAQQSGVTRLGSRELDGKPRPVEPGHAPSRRAQLGIDDRKMTDV